MSNEEFKNPLTDKEKSELIKSLGLDPQQIVQVESSQGKVQLKVDGIHGSQLKAHPRVAAVSDLSGQQKLQWVYDRSRYECLAELSIYDQGGYLISFHFPIFKIQRRQNFRTPLPEKWKKLLLIDQINEERDEIRGEISDISLTGCFFTTDKPGTLVEQDEVYGELQIEDFKVVRFKAQVIRRRMTGEGKGFGLRFTQIDEFGKETLHQITVKAARVMRDYTQD